MTRRIFRAVLSVSFLVCIVGMVTVFMILFHYFDGQLTKELSSEAKYLALSVENYGMQALEDLPDNSERVTLVAPDGRVLFDNHADPDKMDNHANREEIVEAMKNGSAKAVRRSDTIQKQTVYYALKLSNNCVLRVSSTQYTVVAVLAGMIQPFLWITFTILMAVGLLASRISRKIVEPLNQLDLENPDNNESYDELAPLLTKISFQQKTIQRQLLLIDNKGEILSGNTSALKILGISPDLQIFIGKHKKNILAINRSEPFRKAVDAVLEGRHWETILEADGGYCQMTANPVVRDGEVEGGVLLFVDVTEQRQNEMLRREFTANVSHELKTPLTSISGFAEIMKDGFVKPQDVPQFAGKIFDESQRLIALVGDIIKISQLDEDMLPYEKEEIDLYELSEQIVSRLQNVAQNKGITMTLTGEPVTVKTVRKIADEVIYNLCDNAIKYNRPDGSVKVSITREDHQVLLKVEDTGIGISPADQRRVFERFYRVDKSHSKQIGGTGLGLSIVKHGAAYLGVKIGLESVLGEGSCFSLSFPDEESLPQKCDSEDLGLET